MQKDLMLPVRLEKSLNDRLDASAKSKRRTKSELVRRAIERLLEDEHDLFLAERALSSTRSAKTLRHVIQEQDSRC
jgi:predicted DNA-binding protein